MSSLLLLLLSGALMPGHSVPFTVTQKCFLESVRERWDPGTHTAKLSCLHQWAAAEDCRKHRAVSLPSLLFPHACMCVLTHAHTSTWTVCGAGALALEQRGSG